MYAAARLGRLSSLSSSLRGRSPLHPSPLPPLPADTRGFSVPSLGEGGPSRRAYPLQLRAAAIGAGRAGPAERAIQNPPPHTPPATPPHSHPTERSSPLYTARAAPIGWRRSYVTAQPAAGIRVRGPGRPSRRPQTARGEHGAAKGGIGGKEKTTWPGYGAAAFRGSWDVSNSVFP